MGFLTRRNLVLLSGMAAGAAVLGGVRRLRAGDGVMRYAHMNSPTSINGLQANWFAEAVARNTGGAVKVEVFPASQLGSIKELAEGVSAGIVALSHNTAGGLSTLYDPVAALDTPYLYRDVDHLMKVVDTDSPVMAALNDGLVRNSGVRILYAFYFGTRQLTLDRAVRTPADLGGVKVRAIPSPIYLAAVEGLGAVPVPVDWSEVPTALATGIVSGQENPVEVVIDNQLYEVQSHLILTGHIRAAELVVVNEEAWRSLTPHARDAFRAAAREVRIRASRAVQGEEAADLAFLGRHGMAVTGPDNGLDLAAFRAATDRLIARRFGDAYGGLYRRIADIA
jgi:tripartite ATP-independent transporter DctP family solute receptor